MSHFTFYTKWLLLAGMVLAFASCGKKNTDNTMSNIDEPTVNEVVANLGQLHGDAVLERAQRSVPQVAALWTSEDGTPEEFKRFCEQFFLADSAALDRMAATLQANLESLWGCFNKMSVDLKLPLHVTGPEPTALEELFGGYDPAAHFDDDMFQQKIAFAVVLNFPFYTLAEKDSLGTQWSRKQWAYARLGDLFTSRVPAECNQLLANQLAAADNYISNYNIMMGHLVDDQGNRLFPDMALITHWGLRDELKTHLESLCQHRDAAGQRGQDRVRARHPLPVLPRQLPRHAAGGHFQPPLPHRHCPCL